MKMLNRALGAMVALALACLPLGSASAQVAQGYANTVNNKVTLIPVTPATPLPVGLTVVASANFTTPSGTTAYAVGDLIANSGTAGSVTAMSFTVARVNDGTGMIRRARVKTTDSAFAAATIRVHLYKSSPTFANGDNGAWSTTESNEFCEFDVTLDRTFTDAVKGIGVPITGSECNFDAATGTQLVYGAIETRTAVTPAGSKVFTVTLEAWDN